SQVERPVGDVAIAVHVFLVQLHFAGDLGVEAAEGFRGVGVLGFAHRIQFLVRQGLGLTSRVSRALLSYDTRARCLSRRSFVGRRLPAFGSVAGGESIRTARIGGAEAVSRARI